MAQWTVIINKQGRTRLQVILFSRGTNGMADPFICGIRATILEWIRPAFILLGKS